MNLMQLKAVETGSEGDGEGKANAKKSLCFFTDTAFISNAIRQEVTFNRLSNWYLSSPSDGFLIKSVTNADYMLSSIPT